MPLKSRQNRRAADGRLPACAQRRPSMHPFDGNPDKIRSVIVFRSLTRSRKLGSHRKYRLPRPFSWPVAGPVPGGRLTGALSGSIFWPGQIPSCKNNDCPDRADDRVAASSHGGLHGSDHNGHRDDRHEQANKNPEPSIHLDLREYGPLRIVGKVAT